jgi:hypothetical protein
VKKDFIPSDAVVAELKRKAAECEQQATTEEEPRATELRDEAKRYSQMAASLGSGLWTS